MKVLFLVYSMFFLSTPTHAKEGGSYDKPKKVEEKSYEVKDGKVSFHTVGTPALINIDANGGTLAGKLTKRDGLFSGAFAVELNKFDTGISLRNEHMKDKYLEVEKYPEAKFSFKDQADDGELEGDLTIKKDTHPAKVKYERKDDVVKAKSTIEVKDYPSIGVPSWLGVTAAGSVDLEFEFKLAL